jgi:hypothetical protein
MSFKEMGLNGIHVRDVQRLLQNIDINLAPLRKSAMLSLAVTGIVDPDPIGISIGVVAAVQYREKHNSSHFSQVAHCSNNNNKRHSYTAYVVVVV